MKDKENLFAQFPPVSKAEWLQKVEKDLKGRPLEDLSWAIEEGFDVDPFYHAEDQLNRPKSLDAEKDQNHWEIAEQFDLDSGNYALVNKAALAALMGGAEALQFRFKVLPSKEDLMQLLEEIELSYISLHFDLENETADFFSTIRDFIQLATERGEDLKVLSGSFRLSENHFEQVEQVQFLNQSLPQYKIRTIVVGRSEMGIADNLASAINVGSRFMEKMVDNGFAAAQINQYIQFSIHLDCRYFVEIARIRALKLLWANVLKAYQIEPLSPLCIEAHLLSESQKEDQHENMIRATTQAMSAVLGGVDRLTILPANANNKQLDAFTQRIARNVQHLLKMETDLDRVVDPAAGTYYIETLTQKIALAAWKRFQEKETKG